LQQRLYIRILPLPSSLEAVGKFNIPPHRIIAISSPLSMEMNRAIMKEYDIKTVVTKESGEAGGLPEKIQAASSLNIKLLVIERPHMIYPHQVNDFKELKKWLDINIKIHKRGNII
jgi:precorrin-6x reductase